MQRQEGKAGKGDGPGEKVKEERRRLRDALDRAESRARRTREAIKAIDAAREELAGCLADVEGRIEALKRKGAGDEDK